MPTLEVNNFNIVLAVLGGWISLFGLVSYLCKEHFYLSEACELSPSPAGTVVYRFRYLRPRRKIKRTAPQADPTTTVISLLAGAAFSPHASNLIRPLEYA